MSDHPRAGKNTRTAMEAHSALYVWGCVVDLLEGGSAGHCNSAAVRRVIATAKKEQQRELSRMDKAVGNINGGQA